MALEAMLWATMPGREVMRPIPYRDARCVHLHTDTFFQLCTQRCIQDMNMRSLESQLRVCYLCRFLHFRIELEASSGHLRHDCYLHSILFLLGIHLASGVLVSNSLDLMGTQRLLAASQCSVWLDVESDACADVFSRPCACCRHDKTCVAGFEKRYHGVVSAFMFATETQQTIGKPTPQHSCKDCQHSNHLHVMHLLCLPPCAHCFFPLDNCSSAIADNQSRQGALY